MSFNEVSAMKARIAAKQGHGRLSRTEFVKGHMVEFGRRQVGQNNWRTERYDEEGLNT